MGWIKDTFFGGAAEKAADAQSASLEKAMEFQREYADKARDDVTTLFGPGYADLMDGYRSAQDQIAQGRTSAGNIYSQFTGQANQLLQQGTDASLSALLGRPVSTQGAPGQNASFGEYTPRPQPVSQPQPVQPTPLPTPVAPPRDTVPSIGRPGHGSDPRYPDIYRPPSGIPGRGQNDPFGNFGDPLRAFQGVASMPGSNQFNNFSGSRSPAMMRDAQPASGLRGVNSLNSVQTAGLMQPKGDTVSAAVMPSGGLRRALAAKGGVTDTRYRGGDTAVRTADDPRVVPQQNLSSINLPGLNAGQPAQIATPNLEGIGLSGAEQAITTGAAGAESALQGGLSGQLGALREGFGQGRSDLIGTARQVGNLFDQGVDTLGQSIDPALSQIAQGVQGATGRLDPYSQAGQAALQREAAFSGALGADAQRDAYDAFAESPAQKFMRERQEQALLRNASATGGLRGGSTLTALQEQAAGIAAQQEQQYLDNLRNLAGRGQQAAGQQAGFSMQGGLAGSDVIRNIAQQQAGLRGQQAGLQGQIGQNLANLSSQFGQSSGQAIGNASQNISALRQGTGNTIGGLRMNVGQQAANQLAGLGQGMAQNQLNLGQTLGNLDMQTQQNLANLLQGQGEQGFNTRMQLAQLLANISTGQGTNLSNLQGQIGAAQAGGITGGAAGAAGGIGTLAGLASAFSDIRLKDNVTKLADVDGIGLYAWNWKETGKPDIGVIAQEVQGKYPDVVGERDGFMTVDYGKLAEKFND